MLLSDYTQLAPCMLPHSRTLHARCMCTVISCGAQQRDLLTYHMHAACTLTSSLAQLHDSCAVARYMRTAR